MPWLTALKMVLSAVLVFFFYRAIGWEYGYWAAITVAAVTQVGFSNTIAKGLTRFIGTVIGGVVGYYLAFIASGSVAWVLICFFIFLFLTSYVAVQPSRFSYAAAISGVTMVIVVSSSIVTGDIIGAAYYRTLDVTLGILATLIVNLIIWIPWRLFAKDPSAYGNSFGLPKGNWTIVWWDTRYIYAAIKVSLSCLFTFAIWVIFKTPGGFWATIACLLIMEECHHQIRIRGLNRFWAHLGAAIYGGGCAFIIGPHPVYAVIPLAIGFFVCGYLIGTQTKYSGLGTTCGIAIAIMLLVGSGTTSDLATVIERLVNTMFGVVVAILVTNYFWPPQSKSV